jgi:transcriptional regulator with XRE-family HTH domain
MGKRKTALSKHAQQEQRALGKRIREARHASGLSVQEVVDAADVSKNHLVGLERGLSMPTHPTLRRIARVLGVSSNWLLTGEKP